MGSWYRTGQLPRRTPKPGVVATSDGVEASVGVLGIWRPGLLMEALVQAANEVELLEGATLLTEASECMTFLK